MHFTFTFYNVYFNNYVGTFLGTFLGTLIYDPNNNTHGHASSGASRLILLRRLITWTPIWSISHILYGQIFITTNGTCILVLYYSSIGLYYFKSPTPMIPMERSGGGEMGAGGLKSRQTEGEEYSSNIQVPLVVRRDLAHPLLSHFNVFRLVCLLI